MASMFGAKKPKVDVATQKAQRRQSKAIDDQSAEEAKEIGSRSRLLNSTRKGSGLFSRSGGQGVKETLG